MAELEVSPDPPRSLGSIHDSSANALINSTQNLPTLLTYSHPGGGAALYGLPSAMDIDTKDSSWEIRNRHDGSGEDDSSDVATSDSTLQLPSLTPSPKETHSKDIFGEPTTTALGSYLSKVVLELAAGIPLPRSEDGECPSPNNSTPLTLVHEHPPLPPPPELHRLSSEDEMSTAPEVPEDVITDTVGAIAIDMAGRIACGASSGGIGMKYRGRVGPAALVGVGAAVVPFAEDDPEKKCISTVTSGTGEHMGTTFAAGTCAERLYHEVQKSKTGTFEKIDESDVLKAFIERDFMRKYLHQSFSGRSS